MNNNKTFGSINESIATMIRALTLQFHTRNVNNQQCRHFRDNQSQLITKALGNR